jgi:uncharacterized protein
MGLMLLLMLLTASDASAVDPIPKAEGMVSDFARVLSETEKQALKDKVEQLKRETGFEIAVVTIETTGGEPPFDYSMRMIREWGVGDKERGGMLFLVITKDRQISVRVSTHGEGTVTDAQAGQARDAARPYFKQGQWGAGLNAGVDFLLARVREAARTDPALQHPATSRAEQPPRSTVSYIGWAVFFLLIFGVVIFLIIRSMRRANPDGSSPERSRGGGSTTDADAPISIFNSPASSSWSSSESSDWSSSDSGASDSSFGGDSSSGGGVDGDF